MRYRIKLDHPTAPTYVMGIEIPVSAPSEGSMIGANYVGELQKAVAGGEQIEWEKASDHRHWFVFK